MNERMIRDETPRSTPRNNYSGASAAPEGNAEHGLPAAPEKTSNVQDAMPAGWRYSALLRQMNTLGMLP